MLNGDGAFVLVDGQFGSTGKGLFASYLSNWAGKFPVAITNGGANSGHTFYSADGEKIVLKHLTTFAVAAKLRGINVVNYISPGAIINPDVLNEEVERHNINVVLSANACVISEADRVKEGSGAIAAVAGTRQGVGAALVRKIERDPSAIVANANINWHPMIKVQYTTPNWMQTKKMFLEVSQGFSLGINSFFYPKVTSRECTAMQGLADARIPAQMLNQVLMVVRTYPIRVGNFEGHSSGDWYPDQDETSWEELGVQEELTTVTKRVRRVATFSFLQFQDALAANHPGVVLVNFMNYIKDPKERSQFISRVKNAARGTLGYEPKFLYGYGPNTHDITSSVR